MDEIDAHEVLKRGRIGVDSATSQLIELIKPVPGPVHWNQPAVYTLELSDFNRGIPVEYHDAQILPVVLDALRCEKTSICLLGPPGTGKTRQAWAALRQSRIGMYGDQVGKPFTVPYERDAGREYWIIQKLGRDMVTVISESEDVLRHRYDRDWLDMTAHTPGWLVVDDIGFTKPSEWAMEAIYCLANARRAAGRSTMWTTNLDPDQIKTLYSPAIASRIMGGLVLELAGEDRRQI